MVHAVGLEVLRDVAPVEPDLALVDARVRLLQARLAVAEALDLGAGQDDPGLDRLDQVELVAGAAVARDDLDVLVVALGLPLVRAALGHRWSASPVSDGR